jgi:hypothetical protein
MLIRDGQFPEKEYDYVIEVLSGIDTEKKYLTKELVTLMWFLPTFLTWNGENWTRRGATFDTRKFDSFRNRVETIVMEILVSPNRWPPAAALR